MATHSGKRVIVQIPRGKYAVRQKFFIRNGKAMKMKGIVRRGNS